MKNNQIFIPQTPDGNSVWCGVGEFSDKNSATGQIFRPLFWVAFSAQVNDLITSIHSALWLFCRMRGLLVHRAKMLLSRRSNVGEIDQLSQKLGGLNIGGVNG